MAPEGAGAVDPGGAAGSNGDVDGGGHGAGRMGVSEERGDGATPLAGGLLALVPVGQASESVRK